jgi:hypothetical protein
MRPETTRAKILSLTILLLAVALILGLSACGSGSNSGNATVTSITISPTAATVDFNTPIDLTATVNLTNTTNSTNTAVTWQVNGIGGGNSTVGTITNSPDDSQVGIYTAPHTVPPDNNGQVMITATSPQVPSDTTNTSIVTSNTAIITVGAGLGLTISPTSASVGAGGTAQFSALLNNLADPNATWTVTSTATCDNCIGSINPTTGLYTAPPSPPPGATVTVTAKDTTVTPTQTASATVTIAFSDESLNGPFAFSYSGDDASGFMAVAGSFFADGNGHIQSGVEDVDSFSNGGPVEFQISGTYKVGSDGRTLLKLNQGLPGAATWQFALTSNQHAVMIRFDRNTTGSGTIDQQNLDDISSLPKITGPYVFGVSGADLSFLPMGIAGKFSANGSAIQTTNAVVDSNDNGVVNQADPLLSGSYALDGSAPDTGRGTITLTSSLTGQHEFAFYIVDATHLYLVEIDKNDYLVGNMYSGSATPGTLAAGNYVFTAGGNSPSGAYASGGVFTSAGNSSATGGSISGGAFDSNNAGTVTSNTTLGTCAFTADPTGRVVVGLNLASGACPSSSSVQFAVYQTAQATSSTTVEPAALMLELDSTAVATGSAYLQSSVTEPAVGSFALNLAGQGIFHAQPASFQQDVEGQAALNAAAVSSGNLDINDFNAGIQTDPISTTDSSIAAAASIGRGTAVFVATNPDVSYNLVYYVIDGNTALLFDSDTNRIVIGTIARQF